MAYTSKLFLVLLLVLFAISKQALAGRQTPVKSNQNPKNSKDVDLKQSDFLFKYHHHKSNDHSFLIPGIGRVLVPPAFSVPSYSPGTGSHHPGTGSHHPGTGSYVPGGDDTFIPNPGYEVPNPARTGSVPAPAHP